jgi:hypothetical protein
MFIMKKKKRFVKGFTVINLLELKDFDRNSFLSVNFVVCLLLLWYAKSLFVISDVKLGSAKGKIGYW